MEKKYKYFVCTQCFTFNHASFIVDAMNGFAIQRTTFPVVTVIVDDASTDGEQDVIRQYVKEHFQEPYRNEETNYADIICADHKNNPNCHFVIILLKYNHHRIKKSKLPYITEWYEDAKYHAFCEGDDYWSDSQKLQKQVDFLEGHPNFNVCSHDYVVFNDNEKRSVGEPVYRYIFEKNTNPISFLEFSLKDYFKTSYIRTLACVYRNGEYLNNIPCEKYKHYRDDIFHYYLLKQGKGALLDSVMGVYRIHDGGVWSAIRGTGRDIESSIYNAYNIFTVEKDKRAFYKVRRLYVDLIIFQLYNGKYHQCYRSLIDCYHLLPSKDFIYVIFNTLKDLAKIIFNKLFHRQ